MVITKQIKTNGKSYSITITDQVIQNVNNLKSLYETVYEDAESFDQVSSEISNTINNIAEIIEPKVSDSDLDGLIQEIIKIVDNEKNNNVDEFNSYQNTKRKRRKSNK